MCKDISLVRRISMAEKKDNVASRFKDNVFCMLYRDKRNLLELYNALNNSTYTNVDDLQVTTLNGGSYMKYKNDASFLLCMSLYMFEQQSSKNPNMPLRFLHYVSDVFKELFSNDMLHRRSLIKIPVPHFVTFYNGLEKWIDEEDEIKLSDMYEIPTDNPELELRVRVININRDAELLGKCKTLRDYMTFVKKVRYKMGIQGEDVRFAVTEAMDECIEEEVREKVEEEVREKVEIEVKTEVYLEQIIKKVKKSQSLTEIASQLEEAAADIKPLYDAVVAAAPEYNLGKIKENLKGSTE